MKAKWHDLTLPQRVLLLLQASLIVLFLILYATLGRQQVIKYQDTLFRCQTDGDVTSYSGKLNGEKAVFTVSPGPVVEFRWGDVLYGPYSITEDPTAIPDEQDIPAYISSAKYLTGVEVRRNSEVLFRGAFLKDSVFFLISEDGSTAFSEFTVANAKNEPSVRSILRIALSTETTQRGHWGIFLLGVFVCAACAVSVLFADELFRFNLRFRISNPEDAEPSEWELFSRWLGWVVLTIVALVAFIIGLNAA